MLKCVNCSKDLIGKQTKFCSLICKNTEINTKHQNYKVQRERGARNKQKLLDSKGCKCSKCGYNKNSAALCFHHIRDKEFQLDLRNCANTKWETLVEEADKCIILCHNCHMEEHYPNSNLVRPTGFEPAP